MRFAWRSSSRVGPVLLTALALACEPDPDPQAIDSQTNWLSVCRIDAGQDRGAQGDGAARGRAGHGKAAQGQGTDWSGRTGTTRSRVRRRTRRGQDVSRGQRQAS